MDVAEKVYVVYTLYDILCAIVFAAAGQNLKAATKLNNIRENHF